MKRRNTLQKEIVLNAVQSLKNHATAEEIYTFINKEYPNISKGTVYRNLNVLSKDGLIQRVEIPNAADHYDHNYSKHFHVHCIKCNKVFDVFSDDLPNMLHLVQDTNEIHFLDYDIMFKGICRQCQQKMEKKNGRKNTL